MISRTLLRRLTSSSSLSRLNSTQSTQWSHDYERDGYLVVKDVFSTQEVNALSSEIAAVARGDLGEIKGLLPFDSSETDEDIISKYLAFHHPHKVSNLYKETMSHPKLTNILTSIVSPNVKTMQSMFFVKAPGKPGQAWHQDEIFIPTRDQSLVGAWIALDDATIDNGCLFIHPGSHKEGILYPMKPHSDERFDPAGESYDFEKNGYDYEGGDAVEVKKGDVVLFHGYTLHRSLPNTTEDCYRRALVIHYMSAESFLPWDCDATIEPTEDNRDIIIVAGEDPHAYKGVTTENTFPFIRPDKGSSHGGGAAANF